MSNFVKFKKKIIQTLTKLKKDKKSLHVIEISNSYIKKNFNFNYKENNLSDEAKAASSGRPPDVTIP